MNEMMDATNWVGFLVFACGLYAIYAAYQMKCKGIINTTMLLSKDTMYKTCKDKEGYIKEMFPVLTIFAVVTTLSGAVDIINSYVMDVEILYYIVLVVFVAVFLWFAATTKRLKEKYY